MRFVIGAALAALAKIALGQGTLIINTPASLVECQPALLSFSGGTAPYYLAVLPAGQASATPLLSLPDQSAAGTYTWTVNLPAGTNITLQIRDGTGALNYGSPLVIQAGTDSSCLDATAASSASAVGAGGASVSTTVTSAAAATASSLVTSSGSATVTAASGTPSSTSTTGSGNSTSATGNFTCSQGLLTYGISISPLGNVSLSQATRFFGNLSRSQPTATNVSGSVINFSVSNLTYAFNTTLNTTTSSGSLHQQFSFLGNNSVDLGNTTLYDAFEDLQVYRNTTTQMTEVQYFILACFSEQSAGIQVLGQIISAAVDYWSMNVGGSSSNSSSASGSMAARRAIKLF